MKELLLNIEEKHYALLLRFLKTLNYVKIKEKKETIANNYDFSDLVGKLKWKGDALAEQKNIRDEW